MTAQEIKDCTDEGYVVYWASPAYHVEIWAGKYVIAHQENRHAIGLVWKDGVTLNGKEEDFYIGEKPQ